MTRFGQGIRRLALVRLDGISDFLLWVSTAEHYRQHFRDAEIVLVGHETLQGLAKRLPFWDRFVPARLTATRELTVGDHDTELPKFDLIINTQLSRTFCQDMFISRLDAQRSVAALAQASMTVDEFHRANRFYSDLLPLDRAHKHEIERNFEFLNAVTGMEVVPRVMRLDRFIDPIEVNLPSCYAAIFPAASSVKKAYPWPRIVNACKFLYRQYGLISVLCGSGANEDSLIAGNIQLNAPIETVNLTAKLNPLETFDIIRRATVVVSNESMAAHAANLLAARSVCILGGGYNSFDNIGRFFPYPSQLQPPSTQIILQHRMSCYACNYHCRYDPLVRDCLPCIDYISEHSLIGALARLLGSSEVCNASSLNATVDQDR